MISVEVIQEIIHRYSSVGRADRGRGIAMDALDLFAPVLPVTHDVVRRAVDMVEQYQTIRTRDLVHVATCLEEGIGVIVSPDEHFDGVREIRRVAPGDAEALAR